MATNPEIMTNEEAIQAAVAWGQQRYPHAEVRGSVADRMGDDVFVDIEIPEEASVMMVHVRRDRSGGIMVDQQDNH